MRETGSRSPALSYAKVTVWIIDPLRFDHILVRKNTCKVNSQEISLHCRCLIIGASEPLSSWSFIWPAMLDLEWERTVGVRGRERAKSSLHSPHPHPSPYFWPLIASLVQISFSPQPSAAIKIKDGGHSFREENTEHSLAKNTPALQTTKIWVIICCSCRLMGFCRRSSIRACLLVCDQLFFLC